jgi:hypothetical protein
MEWAFYFQPTRGFVYVRVWGIAATEGFGTVRAAMVADGRFDPTLSLILDLGDLDLSRLTSQDIANLASSTEFDQTARRALVVRSGGPIRRQPYVPVLPLAARRGGKH